MKVLHKIGGWEIGVLDIDNFYIAQEKIVQEGKTKGEVKRANMRYFPTLERALLRLADVVARSECASVSDYLVKARQTASDVSNLLSVTD